MTESTPREMTLISLAALAAGGIVWALHRLRTGPPPKFVYVFDREDVKRAFDEDVEEWKL